VNDFIDTVGNNQRIQNPKVSEGLTNIAIDRLKQLVADQVCMATGGPCTYQGRDMKSSHVRLDIINAEFDYVVDDLVKTLKQLTSPIQSKRNYWRFSPLCVWTLFKPCEPGSVLLKMTDATSPTTGFVLSNTEASPPPERPFL